MGCEMKMNFKLHNLACPMCAAAVQNAVGVLPGVNKACAHFSNRILSVEGKNLDSKSIIAAIQETGNEVDAVLREMMIPLVDIRAAADA